MVDRVRTEMILRDIERIVSNGSKFKTYNIGKGEYCSLDIIFDSKVKVYTNLTQEDCGFIVKGLSQFNSPN